MRRALRWVRWNTCASIICGSGGRFRRWSGLPLITILAPESLARGYSGRMKDEMNLVFPRHT
eukprot:8939063-Pyramimonas_sp.AAC.1